MRDIVVKQIAGYFSMIVTIVAIGLPLQLLIEWAIDRKLVFFQSFLVYFVGVLLGMIVRSQTVRLVARFERHRKQNRSSAREEKIERLLDNNWTQLFLLVVCGAIAGAVVALLD